MADEATTAGDSAKKSRWNSLEVAKLLLAAATPLGLFVLSYCVSLQNMEREKSVRDEARADRLEAENRMMTREAIVRGETDQNAKGARDEAFSRQLATQEQADARDDRIRRELREEARVARTIDERIQVWNRVTGLTQAIQEQLVSFLVNLLSLDSQAGLDRRNQIRYKIDELDYVISSYSLNFSTGVLQAYSDYSNYVRSILHHLVVNRLIGETKGDVQVGFECLRRARAILASRVQADLEQRQSSRASPSGTAANRSLPAECQTYLTAHPAPVMQ